MLSIGTQLSGVVTDATRSGKVKGLAHVAVRFTTLTPRGDDKLPFKILMEQNEQKVGEVAISEIKLNTGIKPEELSQKPEPAKK